MSNLQSQVHIFSVDTGCFYTRKELELHKKLSRFRREKENVDEILKTMYQNINEMYELTKKDVKLVVRNKYKFNNNIEEDDIENIKIGCQTIDQYERIKSYKIKMANSTKERLLELLAKREQMNNDKATRYVRRLNPSCLDDNHVISIFDSTLTRTLGCEVNELTEDIMVVNVFYFDVIKDLIKNGFYHNNEKYVYFTSSAGQIRTKKTVFIKESSLNRIIKTLMCGLTIESINEQGGMNVNKFLAYMALSNSATELWEDFDIRKTIVVPDFETMVHGVVDYVDEQTYTVERREMDVPIPHTDGCGMILPRLSYKNFMCRLPWVKGLLAVFDFRRFIKQNKCSPIVKDIYGVEHNIFEEDIEIIFTESQFKLHKYYSSWKQYQDWFEEYHCTAGKCNIEEDNIPYSKINYQELQTLVDMTDVEIRKLAKDSCKKIKDIVSDTKTMLQCFGAVKSNPNKTPLQKSLMAYPEMLNDIYTKDTLRDIKNSLVKQYRAGKLDLKGKYTFVIPDLYAFCEHLFMGIEVPEGLLKDGEVFCKLFPLSYEVDCLRSPHLYREHAVRRNVIDATKKSWFTTDAVYTSTYDMISKILQFDK